MLRVTIEMLPKGDATRPRILGQMLIANDETGTLTEGNYVGTLHAEYTGPDGRHGRVMLFNRQKQSAWSLVGDFLRLWGHARHPQNKLKAMYESPNLPHRTMELR